jgi:hypothetical protein
MGPGVLEKQEIENIKKRENIKKIEEIEKIKNTSVVNKASPYVAFAFFFNFFPKNQNLGTTS